MITVYKKKPSKNGMELVTLNDIYFNKYTVEQLDDKAAEIIEKIDQLKNAQQIHDKFEVQWYCSEYRQALDRLQDCVEHHVQSRQDI